MGNISSKANIFWTKIADSNFLSIGSYHIVKHMLKHLLGKIKCLSASGCQLSDGSPRVAPLTWSISWDASLALEVTQFSCHLRQVKNLSCCTHLYFIAAPCPIAVLFFFSSWTFSSTLSLWLAPWWALQALLPVLHQCVTKQPCWAPGGSHGWH